MIRGVLGSRASIGGPLGSGRGGAAAAWWLAGGVSAANCVAAYQPKGAASLAASYDNNAAPGNGLADGTYDAAPGTAPTFDTATGWTFNGSSQYLTTGVAATSATWSMIIRISNFSAANTKSVFGAYSAPFAFLIQLNATFVRIYNGNATADNSPAFTAGVYAIADRTAYRNGTAEANTLASSGTPPSPAVYIGAMNFGGSAAQHTACKVQAAAIYNTTLTAPQLAAISAAMAAL